MSVDELLATPKVEDRTKFFDYCRRISPDGIICLASAGLIIQKMVATFSRNPDAFDWMHVTICLKAYEDAIARYEEIVTDEKLSEEQRNFAKKVKKHKPRAVAVLGVSAYRLAFDQPRAQVGAQAERIGDTLVWVLPNPSGLNAHFTPKTLARLFSRFRQGLNL